MAELTVYAPTEPYPPKVGAVIIEVRRDFAEGSGWLLRPDIEFVEAREAIGGHDLGSMTCRRRIGLVKYPHAAIEEVAADELIGWWIRARLIQQSGGDCVLFTGLIESEAREELGGDARDRLGNPVLSETRTVACYSPRHLLRKIHVSDSIFLQREVDASGAETGLTRVVAAWMPDMNGRDRRNMLTGNRSARRSKPSGDGAGEVYADHSPLASYLFGGTDLWSRMEFIEYLLNNFVNVEASEDEFAQPIWSLGGQYELLADAMDHVSFGAVSTMDDMLRQLIQPRYGVDWTVRVTEINDKTFCEIHVFALLPFNQGFGDVVLPANPNRVEVRTRRGELQATIVRATSQQFARIRIIGARAVLCCSLESSTPQKWDATGVAPSLEGKWTIDQELEYRAGADDAEDAAKNDLVRGQPRLAMVYQDYGAAAYWHPPVPKLLSTGEVKDVSDLAPGDGPAPENQRSVRSTLSWIPLKSGVDYSGAEPVDLNPEGVEAAVMPPMVWIYREDDPASTEPLDGSDTPGAWIPVERAEEAISVRAARHDWGVTLSATPNHILGRSRFNGQINMRPSNHDEVYNPGKIVATIAFEIDQRLILEYAPENAVDGSRLIIEVPDAECWHMADQTVVGVSADGRLIRSGPKTLRNDAPRLALIMAGAIARYESERARAELVIEGWAPWAESLGHILTKVIDGTDTHELSAPLSSIEWKHNDGKPQTVVKTGYAR